MKLHLMSDLHFEHLPDYGRSVLEALDPTGADALVLAGDILSFKLPDLAERVLSVFAQVYGTVFYVPGNHEYYKTSVAEGEALVQSLRERVAGLHVLQPGRAVEFQGRRFLGGTLWFGRRPRDVLYRVALNDFHLIDGFTPWVWEENKRCVEFLRSELREGDVVVTHHLPSEQSTPPLLRGSPLSMFFVSDQEALIHERRPAAWLHGHTHRPCRYRLGQTEVRANPKGYPRESRGGYGAMLVEL